MSASFGDEIRARVAAKKAQVRALAEEIAQRRTEKLRQHEDMLRSLAEARANRNRPQQK